MVDFDFGAFDALTFDTYGTLIDWEAGILAAFAPAFEARRASPDPGDVLERYARHEAAVEAGPYLPYAEVLGRAFTAVCRELGFRPDRAERAAFSGSVGDWPAFADSAQALAKLQTRFRLGVITNCDDDLFALSSARLRIDFDWVVTAQQAGAYKPSTANFELAFTRIDVPRQRILHVAQSLFHDHVPAKALGMTTVWVDRRR
ncbi:MAG TPA: haloacid dehalogenase type II, partial [Solirubrobacteraceae bacterium]|nr:haloacid dehalogenase type II [Solirubrobacteraceae bacterium]